MLKIKAYHLNPVNILCLLMLAVILVINVAATNPTVSSNTVMSKDGTEYTLPFKPSGDYQIDITNHGKYAILYDGERLVGVMPLAPKCNFTKLIMDDNE